ncbi:MAG: UvrD-helicase domain-containing protein, partial [Granulosicoccaceae bacterium]
MNAVSLATRPDSNATVSASAGSGKTWMLITRIIRLLLAGAPADGIVAITFTRKAAAEMQERLMARLNELACADDDMLRKLLEAMSVDITPDSLVQARTLYEQLLRSRRQPNITTFHAFSQQLLRRFPLEADVPAAFELVEQNALLINEARDALLNEANNSPHSEVACSLLTLYQHIGSQNSVRKALDSFLEQRVDWWAMTQSLPEPVKHYQQAVHELFQVDGIDSDARSFFNQHADAIREYARLRRLQDNKTNNTAADKAGWSMTEANYAEFKTIFFTAAGDPRKFSSTAASTKARGEHNEKHLMTLHAELLQACEQREDQLLRVHNARLNAAWYEAGQRFVEHYQAIKHTRRVLDFNDLEWKAYCLLNTHDNAHWIQYKLDQRIDHLLVDEFQDTNPVNWRLLLPILEELAASEQERQRSVFLVGDTKQAIYGFRRADSTLFEQARNWLEDRLHTRQTPLTTSRRSAPAIMDFVNAVFAQGPLHDLLDNFVEHDTYQQQLWGEVEILPLIIDEKIVEKVEQEGLRDPLHMPRPIRQDQAASVEAAAIAQRIRQLLDSRLLIEDDGQQRPLMCSDIIILLRARTAARHYETALREADIPYFGTERGTLFDCSEIQDMLALLDCLLTPYNNLALARILRSPIFSLNDGDLAELAIHAKQSECNWFTALGQLAQPGERDAFTQSWALLANWHNLAGKLPVHDLLDRIYCDANILARFKTSSTAQQASRVHANLVRFLELALEIDSGRYPSLEQFRNHLRNLHKHAADRMDIAQTSGDENRVRIMTIHGAKGLEAPVVFLVDSNRTPDSKTAWKTLVNWPANLVAPEYCLLLPPDKQRDSILQSLDNTRLQREAREEANLLYVALTRAKHMLIISGHAKKRDRPGSWYEQLCQQLGDDELDIATRGYCHR